MAHPAPAQCGKRLLHNVIDKRAANDHERNFASIPRSERIEDGYIDISYAIFANAINRLAHWITDTIGPPSRECEPIVYLAPLDLRYQILMVATVKAGYIACLMSPRNSKEAYASLLNECGSNKLLTSDPPSPAAASLMKTRSMDLYKIPALQLLLDETVVPHIFLDATWEQWRFRPFLQIHSSGSTGTPKLVTLKHGSFAALDGFQLLESNELAERFSGLRLFVSFPPFHVAGVTYTLAAPIWVDSTVVLPPTTPLTADVANQAHVQAGVECTLLPPSVVVDLAKDPAYRENLVNLSRVVFAGGPLPEATGREIARHTKLYAGYGATEWNAVPQLVKDPEDWAYIKFNEEQGGLEFRERDNGLYEMVICRSEQYPLAQPVFVTFPDIEEFESKDLFSKHPTKPGLWKYTSRLDDIIVFSNGEKLNPVTFEGVVSRSRDVKGCIVVVQGRFEATLLIEPTAPIDNEADFLDRVWPYVQQANESTVRHGRIAKDCIFFTTLEKPLPRAGKGTIQRAATNALYASEVDTVYEMLHGGERQKAIAARPAETNIDLKDYDSAVSSLREYIANDLGLEGLSTSDDFFVLGMDSLQVVNIVRAVNAASPGAPIEAKKVYDNPSVEGLARALTGGRDLRPINDDDSDDEELKESWLAMEVMFQDLTSRMEPASNTSRRHRGTKWLRSENSGPIFPPDGGRVAWLQVLAMALVNFNNFGLVNSYGVFQAYYETSMLTSSSPSAIAFVGTVQGALLLIVGVVSGPLFDKGYFRPTLLLASFGLVLSLMMLSLSRQYYQVMLTQGILLGLSSGLLYIPSVALVPVYFKRRRGLALGLATSGGSIGGVIYPIVFRRLLGQLGFPWAVRVLGFIALVTLGTAGVLSKPIGSRIKRKLLEPGALRELPYLFFLVSAFFLLAAMFVPFFLATSFGVQDLNASTGLSFDFISVINAAQFFGRVLPAWSADSTHRILGPEVFQFLGDFFMGILGFAWISVNSTGGFVPWLIFYGFFSGMSVTLPAVLLPYVCPNLSVYGTRLGMLYACAGVGLLISTPIANALNASAGSFLGSQLWTGACCIAATLLFIPTGMEIRRRRLLYELGKGGRRSKKAAKTQSVGNGWSKRTLSDS